MDMLPPSDPGAALRRSIYGILIVVGLGMVIGRILAVDAVDCRRLADRVFDDELKAQIETELQNHVGAGAKLEHAPPPGSDAFRRLVEKIFKQQQAEKRKQLQREDLTGVEIDYRLLQEKTSRAVERGLWRPFLSANDRSRWCTVRALVEPEMRVPGAPYAIDKVIDRKEAPAPNKDPGWDTIDLVRHNDHYYSSKPPLLSTLMAAEYWVIYHVTGRTLGTHPYEIGRFMLITINGTCLLVFFLFTARLVERLGTTDWGRIVVMASCVFATYLTTFAVAVTNHLPAAASSAVLLDALTRIWLDGDRRLGAFVSAGLFAAMLAAMEVPAAVLSAVAGLIVLWLAPRRTLLACVPPCLLVAAAFFGTNWIAVQSWKPAQMHRSEGDNWYDFPNSYWKNRQGIDQGEKSAAVYTLHTLVGHHGIFSLTPIWLLSVLGAGLWLARGRPQLKLLALLVLAVTVVCLTFYVWWPGVDRNYSGNVSGFRWVFWLAPLWLVLMLPAVDLLSRWGWTRGLTLVLLGFSALSVAYPTWNPWTPPWIMNFLGYLGWL